MEEVRTFEVDIVAPVVRSTIRVPMQAALADQRTGWLPGQMALDVNQPLEHIELDFRAADGTPVIVETLEDVPAGGTVLTFTYDAWSIDQLQAPFHLRMKVPGKGWVEEVWSPVRVRISASREMEYIASYGQNVRKLV